MGTSVGEKRWVKKGRKGGKGGGKILIGESVGHDFQVFYCWPSED